MYERVNPVTEAINAYSAVDNIFRRNREEQRAVETERLNRERQRKSDVMASETHGAQMKSFEEQEKLRSLQDDDRTLSGANAKVKQWRLAQMRDPSIPPPSFDEKEMATITRYLAVNPTLSNDPAQLSRQAQAGQRLTKSMEEVAPYITKGQKQAITAQDAPALFQDANTFLSQELNKGEDRYGNFDSRKELTTVYADENNNLLWGVRVTPKDPSQPSYETALTEMRSADGAARALATPAAAFGAYVQANADFAQTAEAAISSALARTGNKDAVKEIQTQLNSEASRIAIEKVNQVEKEQGVLTYEQKRQLFVGLMPKGHTFSTADLKRDAELLYPKPEKETKPRNLIKVEEPHPKDPNRYRERLVDQDNPQAGYADTEPKGWQQKHKPSSGDSEGKGAKGGPTIRYVQADRVRHADGSIRPGVMAFDMSNPTHKAHFAEWVTKGLGTEVFPDQETTKDIVTGETTKSKVAPNAVKETTGAVSAKGAVNTSPPETSSPAKPKSPSNRIQVKQSFNNGDVVLATDGHYYKKTPDGYVLAQVKQRGK